MFASYFGTVVLSLLKTLQNGKKIFVSSTRSLISRPYKKKIQETSMVEAGGLGLQDQHELPKPYLQKIRQSKKGQDLKDELGLNSHGLAEIHSKTLSPKKEKRNKSSNIFYE